MLALPGPPEVNQVVGALKGTHALVLDSTSVDPHTAVRAAASLATGSGRYVEMPILGGPPQAGSWVFLAGGDDADVRDATRLVEPLGRVVHFGPVGSGSRAKLLNNILTGINAAAVAEVLTLTGRLGVDLRTLYEAINGSGSAGRNAVWELHVPKILAGTLQDTFSIDLMAKDMKLAVAMHQMRTLPRPSPKPPWTVTSKLRPDSGAGETSAAWPKHSATRSPRGTKRARHCKPRPWRQNSPMIRAWTVRGSWVHQGVRLPPSRSPHGRQQSPMEQTETDPLSNLARRSPSRQRSRSRNGLPRVRRVLHGSQIDDNVRSAT